MTEYVPRFKRIRDLRDETFPPPEPENVVQDGLPTRIGVREIQLANYLGNRPGKFQTYANLRKRFRSWGAGYDCTLDTMWRRGRIVLTNEGIRLA